MLKRLWGGNKPKSRQDRQVDAIVARALGTEAKAQIVDRRRVEKLQEEERDVSRRLRIHFDLYEQLLSTYRAADSSTHAASIAICEQMIRYSSNAKQAFIDSDRIHNQLVDEYEIPHTHQPFKLLQHPGYKQLAIIREKRGEIQIAIELSERAMSEGWNGDWEKRIARLKKKL